MEIGKHAVESSEPEAGINEETAFAFRGFFGEVTLSSEEFQAPGGSGTNGNQTATFGFIPANPHQSFRVRIIGFRIHCMIFYLFTTHWLECPISDMQKNFAYGNVFFMEPAEDARSEMKLFLEEWKDADPDVLELVEARKILNSSQ